MQSRNQKGSLVWNRFAGGGESVAQASPCDNSILENIALLSDAELQSLLVEAPPFVPLSRDEIALFAGRLYAELEKMRAPLRAALQSETGFISRDSDELLESSLAYVQQFPDFLQQTVPGETEPLLYDAYGQARGIRLAHAPWGTVAAILPQNAFLLVALTVALGALVTGNRAVLRAPLQSAGSARLLAQAFHQAQVPGEAISVILCKAKQFVTALCASSQSVLLHYMGSSQHAPGILKQCFEAGKAALADGAGNVWVFVDEDCEPNRAASILAAGATRYNGQTCTSINGALIHPAIYPQVFELLKENFCSLRCGNPLVENADIGPLFDEAQAQWCVEQMQSSGGAVWGGICRQNYLMPGIVESPVWDSALVREGLFGPALWVGAGTRDDFVRLWPRNRYPICASILSEQSPDWWLLNLPNAARLVFNGDPSIEHIFEPWGGYPASGFNPVSLWHEKYRRVVSIDEAV